MNSNDLAVTANDLRTPCDVSRVGESSMSSSAESGARKLGSGIANCDFWAIAKAGINQVGCVLRVLLTRGLSGCDCDVSFMGVATRSPALRVADARGEHGAEV
jgi:hypothetical protein